CDRHARSLRGDDENYVARFSEALNLIDDATRGQGIDWSLLTAADCDRLLIGVYTEGKDHLFAGGAARIYPRSTINLLRRKPSIIGGKPDTRNEYEECVAITSGDNLECSGIVIAPDVVLTACHCKDVKFVLQDLNVRADNSSELRPIRVIDSFPHGDFESFTGKHDLM